MPKLATLLENENNILSKWSETTGLGFKRTFYWFSNLLIQLWWT